MTNDTFFSGSHTSLADPDDALALAARALARADEAAVIAREAVAGAEWANINAQNAANLAEEAMDTARGFSGAIQTASEHAARAGSDAQEARALAQAAFLPAGVVILWSGAAHAVPTGWSLCDGTAGTPDLRARFVMGAGPDYAAHSAGGAATHTHAGSAAGAEAGGTVGQTTLTSAHVPLHKHTLYGSGGSTSSSGSTPGLTGYTESSNEGTRSTDRPVRVVSGPGLVDISAAMLQAGGSGTTAAHGHSFAPAPHAHAVTVDAGGALPPYYTLCYIMKL